MWHFKELFRRKLFVVSIKLSSLLFLDTRGLLFISLSSDQTTKVW